jgi:cation:H+ antiporter
MLATLAFAVTGISALAYAKRRPQGSQLKIDTETLGQDFAYFFVVYILAIALSPILPWLRTHGFGGAHAEMVGRWVVAGFLLLAYGYYVYRHFKRPESQEEEEGLKALYFQPRGGDVPGGRFIVAQIVVSLAAIIMGAHLFVNNLSHVSEMMRVSPLVLSLIITPIATELPEKFNSILWVRQGKDTLALGNISGAMVFQSCIPVAVGVTMTDWALDTTALASAIAALLSTAVVAGYMLKKKSLSAPILLAGVPLYIAFIFIAFRAH